jgi:hypothetical protein
VGAGPVFRPRPRWLADYSVATGQPGPRRRSGSPLEGLGSGAHLSCSRAHAVHSYIKAHPGRVSDDRRVGRYSTRDLGLVLRKPRRTRRRSPQRQEAALTSTDAAEVAGRPRATPSWSRLGPRGHHSQRRWQRARAEASADGSERLTASSRSTGKDDSCAVKRRLSPKIRPRVVNARLEDRRTLVSNGSG